MKKLEKSCIFFWDLYLPIRIQIQLFKRILFKSYWLYKMVQFLCSLLSFPLVVINTTPTIITATNNPNMAKQQYFLLAFFCSIIAPSKSSFAYIKFPPAWSTFYVIILTCSPCSSTKSAISFITWLIFWFFCYKCERISFFSFTNLFSNIS